MKTGDLVQVKTVSDGVVARRIVEIVGDTVYICTEEEWQRAKNENREPDCAGFNRKYIVSAA